MEFIKESQLKDEDLKKWKQQGSNEYFTPTYGVFKMFYISHCKSKLDKKGHWKITLPKSMLKPTIK